MNIPEIFIKGRKISIKRKNSCCTEIHPWIVSNSKEYLILKRLSDEKILYEMEVNDEIEIEIVSPAGILGFQSRVKEVISKNEIKAEIPEKIMHMIKRAFKRVDVKLVSEIAYKGNKNRGLIMDLSEGGVYIAANEDMKVGEIMVIKTVTNHSGLVTVEGKIKRKEKFVHGKVIKKYGYGIEFTELTQENATIIKNYIYEVSQK